MAKKKVKKTRKQSIKEGVCPVHPRYKVKSKPRVDRKISKDCICDDLWKIKQDKIDEQKQIEAERQQKIDEIIEAYSKIANEENSVSMNDMIDAGYTKDTITYYFRNLDRLNAAARDRYPECFYDVYLEELMTPERLSKLQSAVEDHKRFVITTAVTGCQAFKDGLKAISNYCKVNNAHHLVLIASDPAHNRFAPGANYGTVDKRLVRDPNTSIVLADVALNTKLCISTVKLSAKHIDTTTGMLRIAANKGSFIFASPKQRMKAVPVRKGKLPYCVMTPGSITAADYSSTNYMSQRTAFIANEDHVLGGIIVEVVDDTIYHFRQFQLDEDGSFFDFEKHYKANGQIGTVKPRMILGDIHSDSIDPVAHECWQDIITKMDIDEVVVHDLNDAKAVNSHERDNLVLRAQRAEANQLSLQANFEACADVLNDYTKIVKNIVVVKSNHDDMLDRWLRKGGYIDDPYNHRLALDLAKVLLDGDDPTKYGVERFGLAEPNKVRWLKLDEDYRVAGVQLGCHGHKGPNGSRGNIKGLEVSYGQIMFGHVHSPEILRGAWAVGTSSLLEMEYNDGPSSWMQTSGFLYPNGARTLINLINGKYRLED